MSPSNSSCAAQLRHMVWYNLDLNLLDNALFVAGRLLSYEPRASEAAYLVALCNLRMHQYKLAYEHSKISGSRGTHLGCAFVFAQACLSLGRYSEGITALERVRSQWRSRNSWGKHTEGRRQALPDAAAVLFLLGQLFRANDDPNKASEYFSESLKLNPFMWEAFAALCDLGATVKTSNVFHITQDMINALGTLDEKGSTEETVAVHPAQTTTNDPFAISTTRANGEVRTGLTKNTLGEKLNGVTINATIPLVNSSFETPSSVAVPQVKETHMEVDNIEPPQAPIRRNRTILGTGNSTTEVSHAPPRMKATIPKIRKLTNEADDGDGSAPATGLGIITDRKRTVSGHAAGSTMPISSNPHGINTMADPNAPQARRSTRILNSTTTRPTSRLATSTTAASKDVREVRKVKAASIKGRVNNPVVGRVVSGNRKHEPVDSDSKESRPAVVSQQQVTKPQAIAHDKNKEMEGLQILLENFRVLANGYQSLSQYRCQEAVQIFNSLPQAQRDTPWVLSQMGRAYFEQSSWAEAEKVYSRVRTIAPSRVDDLEFYSTALWHLKREVELSFLAHEVMDLDRLSPQAWCIVGNSLSLQRDHEAALKCFKRATQLEPRFAYAFTLQGHEHIANEEYDKALAAYRSAISADKRHYNAWYGLGKVFEKQGKYEVAEQHYRVAQQINPRNAILVCCIGVVLEKMKKPLQALGYYNSASELAPKSTLARYKKARTLMGIGKPKQALAELLVLKDIAPEEANVHFLLGKVYKTLHDKGNAVKHFTSALNLDPKASQHIKEAMEQMEDELDEDDLVA